MLDKQQQQQLTLVHDFFGGLLSYILIFSLVFGIIFSISLDSHTSINYFSYMDGSCEVNESCCAGFSEEWAKALGGAEGVTTADVTNGVSDVLVIKSKQQLSAAKGAGQVIFRQSVCNRVAKTHKMPYLYMSFSATEPYN